MLDITMSTTKPKKLRRATLKALGIFAGIVVVLLVLSFLSDVYSYNDLWMPRGETGSALASISPLKTQVDDAIAAGKTGKQIFPALVVQSNALGTISGHFDEHGAGALIFTLDSSSPKTIGAQIVLQRHGTGQWRCITIGLESRYNPKNCTAAGP